MTRSHERGNAWEPVLDPERPSELQHLLEAIATGAISDADELDEASARLLREHFGEGEELQDVLDRLRGAPGDER